MTMKRSLVWIAGCLIATGVLAPSAMGESHNLSGKIHGDSDAKVSMEIVMGKGKPREARKLKFTNFDYTCDDGTSGKRTFVTKSVETRERGGQEGFALDVVSHDAEWNITGNVADDGLKVRGAVYFSFAGPADQFCTSKPGGSIYSAK
jgi:hypothetical protein